jgi:Sulfatase
MRPRVTVVYPFLFVLLPILSILTRSPGESSLPDVAVVFAVMLGACAVVYALVALVLGRKWGSPVAPLIVLAAVLWFYATDTVLAMARRFSPTVPISGSIVLAVLATMLVVWWLARRPAYLNRASTFLTLVGFLLVGWLGFRFVADEFRAQSAIRHSSLAAELARPVPLRTGGVSGKTGQPDVYLILMDEYANSAVLRDVFKFDNGAFEDSLRQLGFVVPRVIHSNYVHTILSLPSLLNFSHLTPLTSELGDRATDPTLPNYLLENNRTAAFLKSRGYRFIFFPSQWWFSTEHNRNADSEFHAWHGLNPAREATRSDLRRSLARSTALDLLLKDHGYDADHVKRTLDGVARVSTLPEPTFVFAHILNPHRPYVFDEDCESLKARLMGVNGWSPEKQSAYIDQVQCMNHLVLGVVKTILRNSTEPPIILLQGDHGTSTRLYFTAKSAEAVSPAQARERFGAFGAYYLPHGGDRLFQDSVTLVNVFRKVLDYYFQAGLPLAPDNLYMSLEKSPYRFVRVDPATLAFPQ